MKKRVLLPVLTAVVCLLFDATEGAAMGAGRAYESEIRMRAKQIKVDDGIDKEEAIILAQNQLLEDNRAKGLSLRSAEVFGENDPFWDKDTWHITGVPS